MGLGLMENQMETSIIFGLYRDNGKENGHYYLGFRVQGLGFRVQGLGFRG